jgi:ubiquinone/menaquinone biosynthesis C-methylase UbiE
VTVYIHQGNRRVLSNQHRPRREYDELASRYDRRWARYVELSTLETLRRSPLVQGLRVLDVGCGTGSILTAIAAAQPGIVVTGMDLSERMLHVAANKADVTSRLVCADAQYLPFIEAYFDIVFSVSVLHYLPSPRHALAEAGRVLKPGGRLVITDWCHDFLACRVLSLLLPLMGKPHEQTYSTDECRQLLQKAGFDVTSMERYKITPFWGLMTAVARKAPV